MASDFLTELLEEKMTAWKAQREAELAEREAQREAELAEREAHLEAQLDAKDTAMLASFQRTLEEAVIARFPEAPIALVHDLRQLHDLVQIQHLIVAVVRAPDLAAFRQELAQVLQ